MAEPTGKQIGDLAETQIGDDYDWGAKPDPSEDNPKADGEPEDCSGLVHWTVNHLKVSPPFPDGSANQHDFCQKHGTMISVEQAKNIRGALLFHPGHVAVSYGDGKSTIEAMGRRWGVVKGPIGDRFTSAAKIPGVSYES
ncbi:MAG: NlpC/P60 family protein [Dehalococcoidia bacterium]